MRDRFQLQLTGRVKITDDTGMIQQSNLVVDSGYEALIRMMLGAESVATMTLTNRNGAAVTPGLRRPGQPLVTGAVGTSEDLTLKPVLVLDIQQLATACRWSALLTPTTDGLYDTASLLTTTGLLIAATSFAPAGRTFTTGNPILVEWTLSLR